MKFDCDIYCLDPGQSEFAKRTDQKTGYRTCSLLCMPIFNREKTLLGVLQFLNKKSGVDSLDDYKSYIDLEKVPPCFDASFDDQDVQQLEQFNQVVGALIYEEITLEEVRRKTENFQ